MLGRVLIVAGSDSGGGAGIQADLKTVLALGAHGATAVTALTAQDTRGVHGVVPTPPAFVRLQMEVVLADIGADAVKTGMLGSGALIAVVADVLRGLRVPVVVDPVMVAKGGARLLDVDAVGAMVRLLLPLAAVLTPNVPEAEALLGRAIPDHAAVLVAARDLRAMGPAAVLLKGGAHGRAGRPGRAGDGRGHAGAGEPAHRHPAHPRHRLHAGERGGGRARAGHGAGTRGPAGPGLRAGGDRGGARAGPGAWAARPRRGHRPRAVRLMASEDDLRDRLRKIEALFAGAGTPGERDAAGAARDRLRARLSAMAGPSGRAALEELQFSMPDMWSRRLFVALCRRYGLEPYRYRRQRHTTVMLRAGGEVVRDVLWPEFTQLNAALRSYLDEVTLRVIHDVVHADTSEAAERAGSPLLG